MGSAWPAPTASTDDGMPIESTSPISSHASITGHRRHGHRGRIDRTLHDRPAGGSTMIGPFSHDSPLSMADWWTVWQALHNPESDRQAAREVMGSLVDSDWLDDAAMGRNTNGERSNRTAAMKAARYAGQDSWIAQRCDLGIDTLQRIRDAQRPYHHARLGFAAHVLLLIVTDLFRLADHRQADNNINDQAKDHQQ